MSSVGPSIQPARSPSRPYAFVRLLVVITFGPACTEDSGRSAEETLEVYLVDQQHTRHSGRAFAAIVRERREIDARAGRVVQVRDDRQPRPRGDQASEAIQVDRVAPRRSAARAAGRDGPAIRGIRSSGS